MIRETARSTGVALLAVILLAAIAVLGFSFGRALRSTDGNPVALLALVPTSTATSSATATATSTSTATATPLPTGSPTWSSTPTVPTTPSATKTPVPTATPVPPTPTIPREPITKVTKMGVGVYLPGGGHVVNTLLRAQPTTILLEGPDLEFAREVRYWFPKAFIVGRLFLTDQPLDSPERRGVELADRIAQLAVPLKGTVNAWQGYNEPVASGEYAGYKAYNALQVAFARRLQDRYGIAALAGNDAPGSIEPSDYPKYFGEAIRASKYFGVHSYAGPNALTFRGPDAPYFGLRHRLIHNALEAAGIRNIQMIITEVGLGLGWRDQVSEETMAADFYWLADELEKDPYVIGMAVFGLFTSDRWRSFNMMDTRLIDLLGQYRSPKLG